jgi:small-conductance mechanosensitive channel
LSIVGLAVLGIDPVALFGFILGFSFMISGASSDYFQGLLFILMQRPYDIGDRIAIASPQSDARSGGSAGWIRLYRMLLCKFQTQFLVG